MLTAQFASLNRSDFSFLNLGASKEGEAELCRHGLFLGQWLLAQPYLKNHHDKIAEAVARLRSGSAVSLSQALGSMCSSMVSTLPKDVGTLVLRASRESSPVSFAGALRKIAQAYRNEGDFSTPQSLYSLALEALKHTSEHKILESLKRELSALQGLGSFEESLRLGLERLPHELISPTVLAMGVGSLSNALGSKFLGNALRGSLGQTTRVFLARAEGMATDVLAFTSVQQGIAMARGKATNSFAHDLLHGGLMLTSLRVTVALARTTLQTQLVQNSLRNLGHTVKRASEVGLPLFAEYQGILRANQWGASLGLGEVSAHAGLDTLLTMVHFRAAQSWLHLSPHYTTLHHQLTKETERTLHGLSNRTYQNMVKLWGRVSLAPGLSQNLASALSVRVLASGPVLMEAKGGSRAKSIVGKVLVDSSARTKSLQGANSLEVLSAELRSLDFSALEAKVAGQRVALTEALKAQAFKVTADSSLSILIKDLGAELSGLDAIALQVLSLEAEGALRALAGQEPFLLQAPPKSLEEYTLAEIGVGEFLGLIRSKILGGRGRKTDLAQTAVDAFEQGARDLLVEDKTLPIYMSKTAQAWGAGVQKLFKGTRGNRSSPRGLDFLVEPSQTLGRETAKYLSWERALGQVIGLTSGLLTKNTHQISIPGLVAIRGWYGVWVEQLKTSVPEAAVILANNQTTIFFRALARGRLGYPLEVVREIPIRLQEFRDALKGVEDVEVREILENNEASIFSQALNSGLLDYPRTVFETLLGSSAKPGFITLLEARIQNLGYSRDERNRILGEAIRNQFRLPE